MKQTVTTFLGLMVVLVFVFVIANKQPAEASAPRFAEYQSTTTTFTNTAPESLIQSGAGTFGSVVITGATTGTINIYDATTSNVNLRTGQQASSTLLKASFPASAVANTYTFDSLLTNGLLLETTGTVPTTTITYRPN